MNRRIWRVIDLIQWGEGYFARLEVEAPRFNIECLLARVLEKNRLDLYLDYAGVVDASALETLRNLVKRRASGEPLQYILGETEFYGRRIRVDPRALIPRPETECLLDEAVRFAEANPPGRAADLGTGSGCLAVALAGRFPELEIDAVDCSSEALSLARENAERNAVSERIRWFREDMVRYLKRHEASLDLVLANPPYVSLREYRSLDRSVRDFEPRGALTDGADGTGVLSPLLETLPGALAPRGAAFVEFGYSMDGWVRRKARDSGLDIEVFEDLKRLPRFARLTRRPPAAEENRGEEV